MSSMRKNQVYDITVVLEERSNYLSEMAALKQILNSSRNYAQASFIQKLMDLFSSDDIFNFIKLLNGVEMWGGSGPVWEVYIEDKIQAEEFETSILSLIRLMEKTKIMGGRITPIKKIFEENLKIR